MPIYYFLIDDTLFQRRIVPALADTWRGTSFQHCRELCASLLPAAHSFAEKYHVGPEEPLLSKVAAVYLSTGTTFNSLLGRSSSLQLRKFPKSKSLQRRYAISSLRTCRGRRRCRARDQLPFSGPYTDRVISHSAVRCSDLTWQALTMCTTLLSFRPIWNV